MPTVDTPALRTHILEAAEDLFSKQGYAGASIADIAGLAGTSKAGVYYHFRSKTEILDSLLNESLSGLDELAQEASEGTLAAEELLGRYIDLVARSGRLITALWWDLSAQQELEKRDVRGKCQAIILGVSGKIPGESAKILGRAAFNVAQVTSHFVDETGLHADTRQQILEAALRVLKIENSSV
jgi:hypothetical protein